LQSNNKPYRLRNVPFTVGAFFLGWIVLLITLTVFLRILDVIIPEQWKGQYHALIIRIYSNFPSSALLWETPLRLFRMNLSQAKLSGANLVWVTLRKLNMREADFKKADLQYANLKGANLSHANLSEANLSGANLMGANLSGANLSGAKLIGANLSNTNLEEANLVGAFVYATSAWNVKLGKTIQSNLIITQPDEPTITVDNLEVAQFIYLLLNNQNIRNVINILTTKAVLILGRFTPERKAVLDALRDELRNHNYLPILFDFDQPSTQTVRETVRTLAHLSHFIIADLTNPSSVPLELETIVPTLPIAVQPILAASQKKEFSMFPSLSTRYHWVLPIYRYTNLNSLHATLNEKVLVPAEQKAKELEMSILRENILPNAD
jgi:Pentapeptide repeats (8 copies)